MTPIEAINRLYHWGFHYANDPNAGFQRSFCAKEVVTIIENRQSDEEAVASIRELLAQWIKAKRLGLSEPIKTVGNIIGMVDQPTASSPQ